MLCRFRPALPFTMLAATLSLACDEAALPEFGEVALRDGWGQSGPPFNTPVIFTSEVAAVDTQGLALKGVKLIDVEIDDGGVYSSIDAGSLDVDHGTLLAEVGGAAVEGVDFIGSIWTFTVDGAEVEAELYVVETGFDGGLWVPGSTFDLRKLDPQRLVYTFRWFDENQQPHDTCKEDAVGGARTVIYGDIVVDHDLGTISARPNTVYFGCISGAVGKAALWGYAPDSPSEPSLSLPAFTTATRMVRADYCADGQPHTNVGNPVTMKDRWAINTTFFAGFTTEAVWEAGGGAKCLRRIRATGATLVAPHTCADGKKIPLCAADATLENRWATLSYGDLWTKIPP